MTVICLISKEILLFYKKFVEENKLQMKAEHEFFGTMTQKQFYKDNMNYYFKLFMEFGILSNYRDGRNMKSGYCLIS